MAAKAKNADVKVLKGAEAEQCVLDYVKKMNRPYGAVDVCANLKGAVPKATTQKILVALAEKGELVMKTYAKSTFFVANQANIETVPADKLAALENDYKKHDEENKSLATEVKALSSELGKVKSTPTNAELDVQLAEVQTSVAKCLERLEPLRSGTTLISPEEIMQIDNDWAKWRAEWVRRRKVFMTFWQIVTDVLSPQDAKALAEDLGIEYDTPEHQLLERSPLCVTLVNTLKRKR